MSNHVRGLMSFRPNDQCYGQNHGIVCDNVPILCTPVYLGMKNNVAVGSFPFHRTKKPFSIFRLPKTRCFVKQPPNECFKMVPLHFSKILDHLTWTIFQPGYLKPFRSLFVKKTNSCRMSRKSVRFELHVHDLILINFLEKSYLCSKYAISSEIHCKCSEIHLRAKNLHTRRFNHSLKQA